MNGCSWLQRHQQWVHTSHSMHVLSFGPESRRQISCEDGWAWNLGTLFAQTLHRVTQVTFNTAGCSGFVPFILQRSTKNRSCLTVMFCIVKMGKAYHGPVLILSHFYAKLNVTTLLNLAKIKEWHWLIEKVEFW